MSLIKEYLKLVEEEKQKKYQKQPLFKPIGKNILFIAGKEYNKNGDNPATGFINYGKYFGKDNTWYKSSRTDNKIKRNNIITKAKVIVYIMDKYKIYKNTDILLENLPNHIEKVYFLVNSLTDFNELNVLVKNIKFPFGCKYKIIEKINEVEELDINFQYAIHSFE
jgi:hypothetical protein